MFYLFCSHLFVKIRETRVWMYVNRNVHFLFVDVLVAVPGVWRVREYVHDAADLAPGAEHLPATLQSARLQRTERTGGSAGPGSTAPHWNSKYPRGPLSPLANCKCASGSTVPRTNLKYPREPQSPHANSNTRGDLEYIEQNRIQICLHVALI